MPKEEMRDIIDSIVPPTPMFEDADDDGGTPGQPIAAPAEARRALLPRQEEFCRRYAVQPVATRAAVLAGYAERSAYNQGHRLLRHAAVLERIAALRAEQNLTYALERDTMYDKLESVFMNALAEHQLAPALAAIRLQARLAGLMPAARTRAAASRFAPCRKNQAASRRAGRMMRKAGRGRSMR